MKIYVFSGTHWDREWYQTFQGFRFRLAKLLDTLIDVLETDDAYGVFHLDGQTIVLEDYLKIRPEQEEKLRMLIQKGKLCIGPWYCMPDEYLLSGESLIKNLQYGYEISRKFGVEPTPHGYICDIFGHIAQMPQIFNQIGIRHALLGRGTNEHTTPMHFVWEAPDGSRVTTFKLQDFAGYGAFYTYVVGNSEGITRDALKERIRQYTDYEIQRSNGSAVLLMDALDHTGYHEKMELYLEILRELYPNDEIYHTNVMDFCAEQDKMKQLPVKCGELNEPAKMHAPYLHLIPNTMSSRYPHKRYNDRLQTLLEKWIQPLYAFDQVDLPQTYVTLAYRYLLQNHPHDSICGCSIDQVHRDMLYRFDQCREICNEILDEFLRSSPKLDQDTDNIVLQLYNPLPYADSRVVEATVLFPQTYPKTFAEPFSSDHINSFRLYDCSGNEIPYGIVNIAKQQIKRWADQNTTIVDAYTITFHADLNACGITEYLVQPADPSVRYLERLPHTMRTAENEWIKLEIQKDGALSLIDKQTGRAYTDLLSLSDNGEVGDGWYHVSPLNDEVFTQCMAAISITENTVNRITFRIVQTLSLPECAVRDTAGVHRSDTHKDMAVTHFVTVARGQRAIKIRTIVDNTIKDHRLRLCMPTGILGGTYRVNQAFCFVERKVGVDDTTQDWKECDVLEKPMSGIVEKHDERGGLAFISQYGLHECGVDDDGSIYVTLLRACQKTVMTNGEPDGQLQQALEYSYELLPFGPETSAADLQRRQDFLQTGIRIAQANREAACVQRPNLSMESNSVLFSTAIPVDNGFDVRICNYSDMEETAVLHLPQHITSAALVTLDGGIIQEVPMQDGTCKVKLKPWQFATIRYQV